MILLPFGEPPLVEALGPPLTQGGGADQLGLGLPADTALRLCPLQILDAGELAIDEHGIGERPEVLRWLQFRRIRRQEEQMDMVRHAQALCAMPPCTIQHEHDLLAW
jgi:hypothetical protein